MVPCRVSYRRFLWNLFFSSLGHSGLLVCFFFLLLFFPSLPVFREQFLMQQNTHLVIQVHRQTNHKLSYKYELATVQVINLQNFLPGIGRPTLTARTSIVCFLREFRPIFHQSQPFQERKRVQLGYRLYQRVRGKIRINVVVSFFRQPVWLVLRRRRKRIACLLVVQRPKSTC